MFFMLCLCCVTPILFGQSLNTTITVNDNGYTIVFCTPDYTIENDTVVALNPKVFSVAEFFGNDLFDSFEEVGYADLPIKGLNLQLPDDAKNIRVTYQYEYSKEYLSLPYTPYQNVQEGALPINVIENINYYNSNGAGFCDSI